MRKLKVDELNRISVSEFKSKKKNPIIVVLDNIRSLYNVGSILRTCDAFLVEKVYLCGITPKPPHREIRKTAIGAEESVHWEAHSDPAALLRELSATGYQIVAAEQTDDSISPKDYTVSSKTAIVFGHEVDGVADHLLELCDDALEIPQFGTKHSLNVSVAAGILIYQVCMGLPSQPVD